MTLATVLHRIKLSEEEKAAARGYCLGPLRGSPAPGEVGLDHKAACPACGRKVKVTVRCFYSHHKVHLTPRQRTMLDRADKVSLPGDGFSVKGAGAFATVRPLVERGLLRLATYEVHGRVFITERGRKLLGKLLGKKSRTWLCTSCSETIEHRDTDCPACGGDTFTEIEAAS